MWNKKTQCIQRFDSGLEKEEEEKKNKKKLNF
uniref:Uncharacterized protein n=1 Tax=Anguilla anguilla TaxID=7936 RepID=A0A0E9PAJ7_ANGAN